MFKVSLGCRVILKPMDKISESDSTSMRAGDSLVENRLPSMRRPRVQSRALKWGQPGLKTLG